MKSINVYFRWINSFPYAFRSSSITNTIPSLSSSLQERWQDQRKLQYWTLCGRRQPIAQELDNLQNDILDLHVALAKKILHMFEKSMKTPPKLGFSLILRGSRMKNYFFLAKINPWGTTFPLVPLVLWNIHKQKYYKQLYFWLNLLSHICLLEPMWSSVVWPDSLSWLIDKGEDKDWLTEKVNCWCTMLIVRYRDWKFKIMWPESLSCLSLSSLCLCLSAAQLSPGVCLSLNISVSL